MTLTTTSKTPLFTSLYETPHEGSMSYLLRLAGMEPVPIDEADIIVFNGGEDIGTSIYGENPIGRGIPYNRSARDQHEIEVYNTYVAGPKLKVGICRGAQLLNCLNGGTLWQDVSGHGRDHVMTILANGHRMLCTSTHHQMMRPNWDKAVILAVSDEATYKYSEKDAYPEANFKDDHLDTEIIYYPDTHTLCIQGHPEYVPSNPFANYCTDLIINYLQEVQSCAA